MKNLKIAYLSWGNSPCNYRRFSKFSELVWFKAELYDPSKKYDIIVVTQNSDLTTWSRFPVGGAKIIFDFVDSYLTINPFDLKSNLFGFAKFLKGQHRYLEWNYNNSIKRMILRADAVVCSTPEQKQAYSVYHQNVFDILDFNQEQITVVKTSYFLGDTVHLAWEGMGSNAWAFQEIAPVLQRIHAKQPLAIHLVTDLKYKSHNGPLAWSYEVKQKLQNFLGKVPVYVYDWNSRMLPVICTQCDIALLPIPREPPIYWAKPENRLLMLWRMGLPVLASANPAFQRCMQAAGNAEQACKTEKDWADKLEALILSETLRRGSAERGRIYGDEKVSETALSQKWMKVLESVL